MGLKEPFVLLVRGREEWRQRLAREVATIQMRVAAKKVHKPENAVISPEGKCMFEAACLWGVVT